MELFNQDEIFFIAKQCGYNKVLNWTIEELPDKIVGYLGEHLHLIIEVESNGTKIDVRLFVKCLPRLDVWKAKFLQESSFFMKEYIMLSMLFKEFENGHDSHQWRPKLRFIKKNVFVFENVVLQGYQMPHHQETLTLEELTATVRTLAKFHAQSYIYEERKSEEFGTQYRIWDHYSAYLQEPTTDNWRNTGCNAVIDYLKVFSKHKHRLNFNKCLEAIVPCLYKRAMDLMKPSSDYRNVIVHRDLWSNNIFLKKNTNSTYHAMFIDFQTVIYCSPMLDLSSLIYFNTTRSDRNVWTNKLIDFYYTVLSEELNAGGVDINDIFDKNTLLDAYDESIVFGITQAALITPIIAMHKNKREEIFCSDTEKVKTVNFVSRSKELIDTAEEDSKYRTRITELLDEIVERFVFPHENGISLGDELK